MTLERVDSPLAGRRPGPLGPVGGVGTMGGQAPPSGTPIASSLERSAAPFWLELKGVERWFDTLDASERLALMAALFGRSSEPQLRQFSAAIDKSLQTSQYATAPPTPGQPPAPPFASHLNRFGMGQPPSAAQTVEYSSLRYRTPLQKQSSGSGNPSSGPSSAPGTMPGSLAANTSAGSASGQSLTPVPGASVGASSVGSGVAANNGSGPGYMSPLSAPLTAPLSGGAQNPFSPAADLYTQAFLPLPRSKSYTPWGPEIRPKSAASDAWNDLGSGRASPQPAQSSPNIAALSLEQPPSAPTSTSPIGHPIKPWRTFTPVGLGQAPEQPEDAGRISRQTPSHTGQTNSAGTGTSAAAAAAAHTGHSAVHSSSSSSIATPLASSSSAHPSPSSTKAHPASPLSVDLSATARAGPSPGPRSSITGSHSSGFQSGLQAGSQPLPQPVPQATSSHQSSVWPAASSYPPQTQAANAPAASTPSQNYLSVSSPSTSPESSNVSTPTLIYGLPVNGLPIKQPKRGVHVFNVALLSDIGAWLRSLRLHKYTGNLAGMQWQEVIQLSDADLEERGVNALGARRKLLKMFEEIRQAQEAGLLPKD